MLGAVFFVVAAISTFSSGISGGDHVIVPPASYIPPGLVIHLRLAHDGTRLVTFNFSRNAEPELLQAQTTTSLRE